MLVHYCANAGQLAAANGLLITGQLWPLVDDLINVPDAVVVLNLSSFSSSSFTPLARMSTCLNTLKITPQIYRPLLVCHNLLLNLFYGPQIF